MSIKKVASFGMMPQDTDFKHKEVTLTELREVYHQEYAARQARREKLQQLIREEESCCGRFKMQFRGFCAWLLDRE